MKYREYEKALSPARLTKYKNACGGDLVKAMTLYRHNVRLCQKFYGILNVFEVVLRNAIDSHYKAYFGDSDWILNQLQPGGMLEHAPQKVEVLKIIADLKKSGRYTNDRVVSSVSFGFWTHLFTKVPYRLGGQTLLSVFPQRAKGMGQKVVFNELMEIKTFRNRIAHHEAICFDVTGAKNTASATDHYALIQKYIIFLGLTPQSLMAGLDVLPDKVIAQIDSL